MSTVARLDRQAAPADPEFLLNLLPHAVLVIDQGNWISSCNAAAEALFHTGEAYLKKLRLDDIVAFSSPLLSLVDQVRTHGLSVNEYEVRLASPRASGTEWVDVFATTLSQDDDSRVMVVLQPRSMAHMIERQLSHRASARSMSGLAQMMAHEIKNPLSGIRGAAQLIETSLDDDGRELTQIICSETDRICALVDSMSVFDDNRPLPEDPVNVHSVLGHVRTLSENGCAKHISFEERYDPSLPPVLGDRDRLVQAILNLVKNAAEAIATDRSDGRIVLTTAFRPGVRLTVPGTRSRVALPLMIEITDNGDGIPEDLQAHLFDPFITGKAGGTGLGLALVAKIIRDHGGVIECESRAGETTFRILLPMHRTNAQPELLPKAAVTKLPRRKR